MEEMWVQILGWEDPLEEEMTTHPRIRAWRILWTGLWWATVQGITKSHNDLATQQQQFPCYAFTG